MTPEKIEIDNLLDARGLFCPMPTVRAREEIDKMDLGQTLQIIADDPAAEEDIPRFIKRIGHTLLKKWVDENDFYFIVRKEKTKNILDVRNLSGPIIFGKLREEMAALEPEKLLQIFANIEAEEEILNWVKEEGHSIIYKSKEGDEILFIVRKDVK